MSIRRAAVIAVIAALAGAATSALSLASGAGRSASTQRCFDFTVVQPDPAAQFAAGTYHRQHFAQHFVVQAEFLSRRGVRVDAVAAGVCHRHRQRDDFLGQHINLARLHDRLEPRPA